VDFPGAIKRGELVIQQPRPQHVSKSGQVGLAQHFGCAGAGLGNNLQHGPSLSRRRHASNDSFTGPNLRHESGD